MGRNKNRHTKDKLYISVTEHRDEWGGKKERANKEEFIKLPFYCCSLSLAPFSSPVCTSEGIVFDLIHILPYIKKYKRNPVTGMPLTSKDLIKLNFYKNPEGNYHCPVTYKPLSDNSHIVAVKKTGNVYSYEAIDQLCRKPQNWKDLLTGEDISPDDIIVLQDPNQPKNAASFFHMKAEPTKKIKASTEDDKEEEGPKHKRYTTGMAAASFTSTSLDPMPRNRMRTYTENEIRKQSYEIVRSNKMKGRVIINTSHGKLEILLHSDLVPIACENFIGLCDEGYYDGVIFHRSIPGFMIQGGDPTGTGTGGKNIFDTQFFRDEFHPDLRHAKRGIVSMANSGPNTNKSQFFITYKASPHLDNKHTVFGELTDGFSTLEILENLRTNNLDRFIDTKVYIINTEILENPYKIAKEQVIQELEGKSGQSEEVDYLEIPKPINLPKPTGSSIGKYLGSNQNKSLPTGIFAEYSKKKRPRTSFDFSSW